jgi:hypothetical protein
MTRLEFVFLSLIIFLSVAVNIKATELLAPHAIKRVIDNYFAKKVHEIEIVNFGRKNGQAEEALDELLRLGITSVPMKVTTNARKYLDFGDYRLQKPSVLLFDSPDIFKQTQDSINFQPG